jgi:hypothetical protein
MVRQVTWFFKTVQQLLFSTNSPGGLEPQPVLSKHHNNNQNPFIPQSTFALVLASRSTILQLQLPH